MRFSVIALALVASVSGVKLTFGPAPAVPPNCEPAIDVSQKQLDIELDYFSRDFNPKHYKQAMLIYAELKKQGKDPKVSIHTWELYDKAFSFPRVRRYGLVQEHMDVLEHF